jgi:hypothetical protein
MSTFIDTSKKAPRKPERIVVIGPELFAFDYKNKPTSEVAIGLRVISENDVQIGRAAASRYMVKMYGTDDGKIRDPDQAWGCWNDKWLAYAIGRSACDPNDVDKPYFNFGEEGAALALSSEGLRLLWDEYMLIFRGKGERPQISDEDLLPLAKSLANVELLDADTLAKAGLISDEDEDVDDSVYVVRAEPEAASPTP